MELQAVLEIFRTAEVGFPTEAVQQAISRREEITPHLLAILENTIANAAAINEEGGRMEHLFAMFLLAQFREPLAWPLVIRLASLPGPVVDGLCGDFIPEDLHRVLASVFDGNLGLLYPLIVNRSADDYVRGAAIQSLATMVVHGIVPRETVVP